MASRALTPLTTAVRILTDTTAVGRHRQNYTRSSDRTQAWELKPESDWVVNPVEPIVSQELWDKCHALLERQRAQIKPVARRAVHLFSGITRCVCGTKMYVRSGSPKYVCEGCRNKIPTADLEAVFLSELRRFLISPTEIAAHALAADEATREKERLIASVMAELKKLAADEDQLFELHKRGEVPTLGFGARLQPISDRKDQLNDELPRLQAELDVMRIAAASQEEAFIGARTLTDGWSSMSDEQKRQMIEVTTDCITVGREEIEIHLHALPLPSSSEQTPENDDQKATPVQGFIAATSCTRAG